MPAASCREFFWFAFKDTKHHKGLLFGTEGPGVDCWPGVCVERVRRGSQRTWVQILALPPASRSDVRPVHLLSLTFLISRMGTLTSVGSRRGLRDVTLAGSLPHASHTAGAFKCWFHIHRSSGDTTCPRSRLPPETSVWGLQRKPCVTCFHESDQQVITGHGRRLARVPRREQV